MNFKTFEDYLMYMCQEDTHALDDDLPDTYEDWLAEKDTTSMILYANLYGQRKLNEGVQQMADAMQKHLKGEIHE